MTFTANGSHSDLAPYGGMSVPPLPAPADCDPVRLGLMQGFPPPPDKRIGFHNYADWPHPRWAFHHLRELVPMAPVWRGDGSVAELRQAPVDLDALPWTDAQGIAGTIANWRHDTFTDALLVLHRGAIVAEHYACGMRARDAHICWSVSKSFTGLLTALCIADGLIDANATLSRYVPELAGSGWADATVQQTLDMTAAIAYTEVYTDPRSDIVQYSLASGIRAAPPGYPGADHLYAYLPTIAKEGEHGAGFHYKTTHTEALAWLLRRVTGVSLAQLLSERLWQPMGALDDGLFWVDRCGTEAAGAGLNVTLRDLARVGRLLAEGGAANGRQIVPAALLDDLGRGADRDKFKASGYAERFGYSYHNQWWIPHDGDGSFEAKGIHGQHLYVNPAAQVVIAKFSSHPVATTLYTQHADRAAFSAIAAALR